MKEITIRDVCGDYALDLPLGNERTFTLHFKSRQNALNVKRIVEVDKSIPNAATVCDVQEVVRCKDCKYSKLDRDIGYYVCPRVGGFLSGNHYCAYGKRKDEHEKFLLFADMEEIIDETDL